jgi:hypothetical protein
MKALTIWQPWASLIVGGWKPYEFRGWAAPVSIVGQRIGIHAAKRPIKTGELRDIMDYACSPAGQADGIDIACMDLLERTWRREVELPMSAVLGTALLGTPKLVQQNLDGPRYAWPMMAVEKFGEPVPAKGAQGFWEWQT